MTLIEAKGLAHAQERGEKVEGGRAMAGKVRPSVGGKGNWGEGITPGASVAAVKDHAEGKGEVAGEAGAGQGSKTERVAGWTRSNRRRFSSHVPCSFWRCRGADRAMERAGKAALL